MPRTFKIWELECAHSKRGFEYVRVRSFRDERYDPSRCLFRVCKYFEIKSKPRPGVDQSPQGQKSSREYRGSNSGRWRFVGILRGLWERRSRNIKEGMQVSKFETRSRRHEFTRLPAYKRFQNLEIDRQRSTFKSSSSVHKSLWKLLFLCHDLDLGRRGCK